MRPAISPIRHCFCCVVHSRQLLALCRQSRQQPVAGRLTARAALFAAFCLQNQQTSQYSHGRNTFARRQHANAWTQRVQYSVGPRGATSRYTCCTAAILDAESQKAAPKAAHQKQLTMDYTALVASVAELKATWIPAKMEQVYPLQSCQNAMTS